MKSTTDRLVDDYLERLRRELSGLPRDRRRELADEIAAHIAEGRAELASENEAEIRNLLERLGDPAEIAAEERARRGIELRRAGPVEIVALVGLLVGGFFAVVGWFVGLVCLWVSDAWTTREKLVGTFVVPGGLTLAFLLLTGGLGGSEVGCYGVSDPETGRFVETCEGGPSLATQFFWGAAFVVALVGPVFTTVFLARRMRRPAAAYQPSSGAA
jgi:hypothetical protein